MPGTTAWRAAKLASPFREAGVSRHHEDLNKSPFDTIVSCDGGLRGVSGGFSSLGQQRELFFNFFFRRAFFSGAGLSYLSFGDGWNFYNDKANTCTRD